MCTSESSFQLFSLHYSLAGLEEAQVGIKTAWRNISYLRYADDTTHMEESEEELKSLLMKVKEEWKSWLKTQHSEKYLVIWAFKKRVSVSQLKEVRANILLYCEPPLGKVTSRSWDLNPGSPKSDLLMYWVEENQSFNRDHNLSWHFSLQDPGQRIQANCDWMSHL